MHEVLVIGSGPAGLACAAELTGCGVEVTVLERGACTGAAWAGRYDSLRFNTSRVHSALPGHPFPKEWGQFPTRDQYVGYLRDHAAAHEVVVRTGVEVERLDPEPGGWRLSTSQGPMSARHVIVATGIFNVPVVPSWPGASTFRGTLLHSSAYREPGAFAGQEVVVVGAGSTGLEIAHEVAHGGAARVHLSVRTPPTILLRVMGGAPADLPAPLFLHLPPRLVDGLLTRMARRFVGDLSEFGLPAAPQGPMAALRERGTGTAIVDREVVDSIRHGDFTVVPALAQLDEDSVVLEDGTRVRADTVIAATGFRPGLEPMVGHLDVLGERGMPIEREAAEALPGLRFVGMVYRPGITGYAGRQARRVAREIAAHATAGRPARDGSTPRAWRRSTSRDHAPSGG